ncbi:type II CRISPR-associated endonuclease Cas1 [Clostridium botulinum]|uniref:type II CRISPR-associated endonuclease Cas1 n=1 Tax=Clostridium botulinum TaxID=1491 RepID=UPI00052E2B0F|nr:type II CRISPR-associated endonuclease Cas1 [Clostridium botulinum]KGM95121.1 CRISPR-associated protein Cas1 [Clostridium botulinum D str. CCUG 7971]KOC50786.1 CRISPR-associated protein Cas1 [Clostridium botulinum]NFO98133.1 type II CRISPR-associated endonuclease Cas1 [Clostridium botulinum]OOV51790.1 subtype II CRISPR-associated endonuclease Cas1 [Clostridium botulinum D/C]OOV57283.1 subtype II CRISPR-associated endonuclease Cas1 [Clostridium botulinum D/C]
MSFRSVIISNSASLNLKNNNLIIDNGEEFPIPIEDISVLVLESISVRLTNRLLSKLAENSVATIICDEKYLPSSIVLPLNVHYKSYKVLKQQLNQSLAFSKRIWQRVIKQKLYNQGECLEILKLKGGEFLKNLSNSVESGDKGNKEAVGARYYFKYLFTKEFIRDDDNGINAALNYGYAIMRSVVARTLVMYGFNTALGVNHCNELNSFNLADDFMEPLRPIVDLWVYSNMDYNDILTKENRIDLVNLVNYECIIDGKSHSILNAIDKMISSYTTACSKKDFRLLKLPIIKPLEYHYYE